MESEIWRIPKEGALMRRKLSGILFGLLFLTGFGILCYPTISDQWNKYRQNQLITTYEEAVAVLNEEDYSREWEAARAFDGQLEQNNLYGDVFGEESGSLENTEYWDVLNISGDGVMGYLSIPKINLKLSIYHGTAEDVLQTGVGHLNGTKLPIGGESTHSVLAAHRGLPSARLFTDIDQLYKGDLFYIHILDEILAYVHIGGGSWDRGGRGSGNIVYLYALRSEFSQAAGPREAGALWRGRRGGADTGGNHAEGGAELLYALSGVRVVSDAAGDPLYEIPLPSPKKETGGAPKRRERSKFPWTGTGIKNSLEAQRRNWNKTGIR